MKTYNIPIFVPHCGCPFDCIFCNQHRITSASDQVTAATVPEIVEAYLDTLPRGDKTVEIAFFGGSFTGIPECKQEELLRAAAGFAENGRVNGIRVSTRPDYISVSVLERLLHYGVTTIELGVQSMNDHVLKASRRGHTSRQVEEAVRLIRHYPFSLGLQMMTGLPEDTNEDAEVTAQKICRLHPDFVRIYPTLVLRDTALEELYQKGRYRPQTLDEAVVLCARLLKCFQQHQIPVIRIALQTTDEISRDGAIVSGPFHEAFRELVETELYYDSLKQLVSGIKERDVTIQVHPTEISKVAGHCQKNKKRIRQEQGVKLHFSANPSLPPGEICLK